MVGEEQLSVPTGAVYVTAAPQIPGVLFTETLAGHVMVGNSVSVTVTVKEQVAVLALASVTLKVLVVIPTGKVAPLAKPAI